MRKNLDIINLDRTNPSYSSPKIVLQTVGKMLNKCNFTSYSEPEGLFELRKALSSKLRNINHIDISPDQIIVTVGSSIAIQLVLMLGNKNEVPVLCPNPGYPSYLKTLKYLKKNVIFYNPDQPENIKSIVSKRKISLCIINTPSNPTGYLLMHDDLKELVALSNEHKFFILSDEAYENYAYDTKHVSPASFDSKGTVFSTFSFSKTFSMSGWRVGYLVLPTQFIQKVRSLYRTMLINTPVLNQIAALAALTDTNFPSEIHNYYLNQRNNLISLLNSSNIPFTQPLGGLSIWINIANTKLTSENFVNLAFKHARIIIQAGNQFGTNGENFIRVSFSGINNEVFEGFNRLINFYWQQIK